MQARYAPLTGVGVSSEDVDKRTPVNLSHSTIKESDTFSAVVQRFKLKGKKVKTALRNFSPC